MEDQQQRNSSGFRRSGLIIRRSFRLWAKHCSFVSLSSYLWCGDNNISLAYPPALSGRLYLVMFAEVLQCFKMLYKWNHFYEEKTFWSSIHFLKLLLCPQDDTFKVCEINFITITTVCIFYRHSLCYTLAIYLFSIHWDNGSAVWIIHKIVVTESWYSLCW